MKRAQIMLADWYTMLGAEKFPNWDMQQLTMFADYRVPAVLFDKGTYVSDLKRSFRVFRRVKADY